MTETLCIDSGTLLPNVDRHFRVVAGPGAGKTYWLVRHIQSVVARSSHLSPAAGIACISYTNVAVNEIVSRLGPTANRVDVSTIHSFLYRHVVRPYLHLLHDGDGSPLVAFGEVDGHDEHHPNYMKIQQWLRDLGEAWILQKTFKKQFTLLQEKLCELVWRQSAADGSWELGPRSADRMGPRLRGICTTANLVAYKRAYWQEGILDHNDVLYFAHRILEEYPLICTCLSARYRYLFIDEFQDTQPIQTKIVEWFAAAGTVVGVIGDAEQSIFGFLDARPEHFSTFSIPNHLPVTIRHNRRSTRRIIGLLDRVRSDGLQQECFRSIDGDPIHVYIGDIEQAISLIRSTMAPGTDLRILTRKNVDARRIRSVLTPGSAELWNTFHAHDSRRARFMEHVIGGSELARRGHYDLALRQLVKGIGRGNRVREPLQCDGELGDLHRRGLAVAILEHFMTNYTGIADGNLLNAYARCAECITRQRPDVGMTAIRAGRLKPFAESTTYRSLANTVRLEEETRHVRTIHQAKGTEADTIVLYLEDAQRVRHITHPSEHHGEEKRITYVGLSRAQNRLFLCIPGTVDADAAALSALGLQVHHLRQMGG